MTRTVRATYANGVLMPHEPLDLAEGQQVTVSIEDLSVSGGAPSGEPHGESLLEMFERLRKSVPPGAWDDMPVDGSQELQALPVRSSEGRGPVNAVFADAGLHSNVALADRIAESAGLSGERRIVITPPRTSAGAVSLRPVKPP